MYQSLERGLSEREQRFQKLDLQERLPISFDDLGWVFEDLYHGRASFPPHPILSRPNAVRWDGNKGLSEDNLVIMSTKDAEKHEKECLVGERGLEEVWGSEVVELVRRKSVEARKIVAYRRG